MESGDVAVILVSELRPESEEPWLLLLLLLLLAVLLGVGGGSSRSFLEDASESFLLLWRVLGSLGDIQ